MRESSQIVRIEKHRVGDIAALTFAEPDAAPAARPLVFVVHGLLSRKERHLELCLSLVRAGFLACTLDARYHGERSLPDAQRRLSGSAGADFATIFMDTILGTVEDIGELASYFRRAGYGIIGHSMGGFIALKTAVTDPGARAVVSISGDPDWLRLVGGPDIPADIREHVRIESPLTHADRFPPRPLLLLHGDADEVVPIRGARALHAALAGRYADDPSRLALVEYPGSGHEFLPDMAERAVAWMERFLR